MAELGPGDKPSTANGSTSVASSISPQPQRTSQVVQGSPSDLPTKPKSSPDTSATPRSQPSGSETSPTPAPKDLNGNSIPALQPSPKTNLPEIVEVSTPNSTTLRTQATPLETPRERIVNAANAPSDGGGAPATPTYTHAAGSAAGKVPEARAPDTTGAKPSKDAPNTPAAAPAAPEAAEGLNLKTLPKVAADAAKQAGQAYVEAGKEARGTLALLMKAPFLKEGPPITLTLDQIGVALFFVVLGFQVLLLPIFMPSVFRLAYNLVWGLLFGLGLSFLFYYNKKRKAEVNELLSINLGLKGANLVAGGLPSWFNISHKEKLEWLNSLIVEVWPFVDKGICQMIKDTTARVMPDVLKELPVGLRGVVKSIGFKHLTFGGAPVRVESIWVSPEDTGSLVMELDVKWCGDPNITLAIEIPTGQKLCPRIMDITFAATVRVVLNPLVPRIPGFVGAMATVPKPPLIKYRLDFGRAMGGSMAPAAVTPVVNFFLRDVITKMLVWPQRLVVPILQETDQDKIEIQRLMRRHRGVLRVCVESAKELRPQEWGTNDVSVELTTDSEHFEATSIRRAKPVAGVTPEEQERLGESVTWNECIFLLIQEPRDQLMRLEAFDIDKLRPSKLLTGQVTQVVNGRGLIGRSMVKLGPICKAGSQDQSETVVTQLGRADWGSPGGPGKGAGKVRLQMRYWPFERFTKHDIENSMEGIVTVRLLRVWGLAATGDSLSAYVRVTSTANKREWKSSTKAWNRRQHTARLRAEIKRLGEARERDLREGRTRDADKKARYMEALQEAIAGDNKRARLMVDLDYTLDSTAMCAIYHVKLTDMIKIKVLESSLLSSPECLGRLDIPASDIVTSCDVNPLSGQREFGLHRRKWEEYNPDQPERAPEDLERGIPLEEGDGARIWVELRWVPCIQVGDVDEEDEEEEQQAAASPAQR
ncbi:hypothetical protein Agub_g212 [Astrephomene gubernaculifera]|uniref:SMP-LTD domain-containing protein n=1 Tax=Astrephomene gubernaculifera TaxID=47775 RepID=A0AAD3DDB9_9CHLO|nr:hypothetical protein Agub_g212 [Astrephomene gubernaculifera]